MKRIAFCNNKGGVGKTTTCFNLAGALSELGRKVLLIDMDQQASLSSSFLDDIHSLPQVITDVLLDEKGIPDVVKHSAFKGIDIAPTNLSLGRIEAEYVGDPDSQFILADKLKDVERNYDFTLIDCPPNLGQATRSGMVASQGLIIPLEAQEYSVAGTAYIHGMIGKVKRRANPGLEILFYLVNRYDGRRNIEQEYKKAIEEAFGYKVFRYPIKDSVKYSESVTFKKPITHYDPKREQAMAFRELAREVADHE
jgi:chromosome partitioning protein